MTYKKTIVLVTVVLVLLFSGCGYAQGHSPDNQSGGLRLPALGGVDFNSSDAIVSQQQIGIWVAGEGKTIVAPDVAILTLGVEAQESTVIQAQKKANEAMNRVMKTLKERGIVEKDIQTRQFSIQPVKRWIDKENREETLGYRVSNTISVKVRKIESTGLLVDSVTEVGGDLIRVNNIEFTVDDITLYAKEARGKAIIDAVARAKEMAGIAQVKLGNLIYMSENSPFTAPQPRLKSYTLDAAVPNTPINPGEMEIIVTVQMVYRIG